MEEEGENNRSKNVRSRIVKGNRRSMSKKRSRRNENSRSNRVVHRAGEVEEVE